MEQIELTIQTNKQTNKKNWAKIKLKEPKQKQFN